MLRVLLIAVNAKYIHTCPAIYSLKAFAEKAGTEGFGIRTAEFTINDRYQDVLAGIMEAETDILAFSVYIWNVDRVRRLIRDIRKIRGESVEIWAGGPEATYYPESFLLPDRKGVDLCMLGEGEEVFSTLVRISARFHTETENNQKYPDSNDAEHLQRTDADRKDPEHLQRTDADREDPEHLQRMGADKKKWENNPEKYLSHDVDAEGLRVRTTGRMKTDGLEAIRGIAVRREDKFINTGLARPVDMDQIPFLYSDLTLFSNRILYYESSRGCPFSCAYCLSGRERGIRYRNTDTVERELQFFLDHQVRQVKFVDRTFNASPAFAMRVWTYIRDHDNGITNFHFEIEADCMTQKELELLQTLRPGLIQMEIGVQSANTETLTSIHRRPDLSKIAQVMRVLGREQNINLHLDLIAGLPYEDLESFRKSFNAVYAMRPHQLQLGFLKLLKGTELWDRQEEYGLICSEDAPYEVLRTRWLSFADLELLHRISDRVEEFVNSQGFRRSLPMAEAYFSDAFDMFRQLADYYRFCGYEEKKPSAAQRYAILMAFVEQAARRPDDIHPMLPEPAFVQEMIRLDQMLHVHASRRMTAEETFDFGEGPVTYCFDYRKTSPVNGEATMQEQGMISESGQRQWFPAG